MNLTNLFAVSRTPTEKSGCDMNWEGAERLEGIPMLLFFFTRMCRYLVAIPDFIAVDCFVLDQALI